MPPPPLGSPLPELPPLAEPPAPCGSLASSPVSSPWLDAPAPPPGETSPAFPPEAPPLDGSPVSSDDPLEEDPHASAADKAEVKAKAERSKRRWFCMIDHNVPEAAS